MASAKISFEIIRYTPDEPVLVFFVKSDDRSIDTSIEVKIYKIK